jgi:hypothetical protein
MSWGIRMPGRVAKQALRLPEPVRDTFEFLVSSLADSGPVRPEWPHYGKIKGATGCHHCHLRRGRPTYVAVWKEGPEQTIEVRYVGTHEGADYQRLC